MCCVLCDRPRARALALLLLVAVAGIRCGGNSGTDIVLPSLTVSTSTIGVELDADGYSFTVDAQAAQPIGVQASVTIDRLGDGPHTVELLGVAPNCAVVGENPTAVTVGSGATARVGFTITCSAGTGGIRVVTITSGQGGDPDGFTLLLDGADHGPIGTSAEATLNGLEVGPHAVGLSGLAANCLVGDNPRSVTVAAGAVTEVSFAVTCTAPGPTTGRLEVSVQTTGTNQDPDGYQVSVDGGAGQPIGINATISLANISAAQHTVRLQGLASNCAVTGSNPLGATVPAGGTATVSFAVTCVATTGELRVTISGLPGGVQAAVTVTGPNNFTRALTETQTLTGLVPGSYGVSAASVSSGGTTYTPSVSRPNVDVAAGATAAVTVSYTAEAPVTLNLRIDGLYLTQSTQTYGSDVPLVAGRAGYLRVFVVANESNTARPSVRVRFHNGSSTTTRTIDAPGGSTPTTVQEGTLGSSWNLPVEAALIRPGLSIEAAVDPVESVDESNENDNRFPATGNKALTVRTVPTARIRFVSVQQGSSAPGDVSNPDQLISLARRMHPLNAVDVDVHSSVFTASVPLQPSRDPNTNGWGQVLSDLDALRVADGSDRTYFGIAKLTYGRADGTVGLAFQEIPTALGWDDAGDAPRVVAHELGHTWGRRHAPCGISSADAGTIDPLYPYPAGQIGVSGFDVANNSFKPASSPDIMGYCFQGPWISDYNYREVMTFRASAVASIAGAAQPSLLLWGRIANGQPVLEPAFQVVTRPSLPIRPGPYSITATAADGSRIFDLSFAPTMTGEGSGGTGHFAFAVPLTQVRAATVAKLQLTGPGGTSVNSPTVTSLRLGTAPAPTARREGNGVVVRWNPSLYPTIMVRDPESGALLAFGRGGATRVWTAKEKLDVELSDGVRSQRVRLAINRS